MSANGKWRIPPSVRRWLAAVKNRPLAVLLRHSVRDALPPGEAGSTLPITEDGVRLARQLGELVGQRLRSLHTSPLIRCVQTAEALRRGASQDVPIVRDRHLGDPGVFVVDARRAWANWESLGHEGVMAHLMASDDALLGMARPGPAARFLVHHMLAAVDDVPGVHVFVTHDSLVLATAARLVGQALGPGTWPWYLEGAFFWRDQDGLHAAYRDHHRAGISEPLCGLADSDVIEWARREIARTVGLDSDARFFLAGGAFKSLVTGRPPRDLDLWAPSAEDRERLISALLNRGARRLDDRPFASVYEIAERVVEVPHSVEPPTLNERLARFDIALSAVGVEHQPGDRFTARVHPLAHASVEQGKVFLLKPLVNWKYALTTLERMRRYAAELDFVIPAEEEAEVWRVFEKQSPEMRAGMLERFARTSLGGFNVAEDVSRRCP